MFARHRLSPPPLAPPAQPLYKAVNSIAAIDASAPLATLAGNIARWQRVDAGEEADPGW